MPTATKRPAPKKATAKPVVKKPPTKKVPKPLVTTPTVLEKDECRTLAAVLKDALIFASLDTMRPILWSVNIEAKAGVLHLVATDSYVLGHLTAPTTLPDFGPVNLARDGLTSLAQLLAKRDTETASVTVNPAVIVASGMTTLTLPVTSGDYPDFQKLFDTNPASDTGSPAHLATWIMGRLAKLTLGRSTKSDSLALRLAPGIDPVKPVNFSAKDRNGVSLVGMWMPVRVSE